MQDELDVWKRNAAQMSAIAMWLKTFAAEIIGYGLNGGVLDDGVLVRIKLQCVRDFKNTDVFGLSAEAESEFIGKVVQNLEAMIDMAIADGRKRKKL
jgi:hypothetical protein